MSLPLYLVFSCSATLWAEKTGWNSKDPHQSCPTFSFILIFVDSVLPTKHHTKRRISGAHAMLQGMSLEQTELQAPEIMSDQPSVTMVDPTTLYQRLFIEVSTIRLFADLERTAVYALRLKHITFL